MAMGMKRDFPRDDWGFPVRGSVKELVVDPRPTIMVENKKKYEPNRKKRLPPLPPPPKNEAREDGFLPSKGIWSFDPSEEES